MNETNLGDLVREWRTKRNLTQLDAARLLDVDPMTVSRIERNRTKPRAKLLARIMQEIGGNNDGNNQP